MTDHQPRARRSPRGGERILDGPAGPLAATVRVPPSKSLTNRALIAAAVADGGTIRSPLECDDTRVLATALAAAGWEVAWNEAIEVGARRAPGDRVRLDLGDSGTGARFILALLAASPGEWIVDGSERLRQRPIAPLTAALMGLGVALSTRHGGLPVALQGAELSGGPVTVRPEVSSQFVSALLLAAPLMKRPLELQVTGPTPSRPYLDLTEVVLREFGAAVERSTDGARWSVGRGSMRPTTFDIEGDWSAAAFFLAAAAVAGGTVRVAPLDPDSRQGDRAVCRILAAAGAELRFEHRELVMKGPVRRPLRADLSDTPDLFPALAAVAASAPPGSRLSGLDHLRHKESDRLTMMVTNLRRLGAEVVADRRSLSVERPIPVAGGRNAMLTAGGDHRIAMAMAVACLVAGEARLDDDTVVTKSFPSFWHEWHRLLEPVDDHGACGPGVDRDTGSVVP